MRLSLLVLLLASSLMVCAQSRDEESIRGLLNRQAAAWNRGDLDGFMQGYWQNDSLMFIGQRGPTYGWKNTLDNYKRSYPDTAAMGQLDFSGLIIKKLSRSYYFVIGHWHLQRSIGDLSGAFTLLFRKIKGQWQIICDHSS